MIKSQKRCIYFIDRYDLFKPEAFKNYSGYEHIVKHDSIFRRIKSRNKFSKLIYLFLKPYTPLNYLKETYSKEIIAFFKALFTGNPIFYLYADKDAYLLPILKRRLSLKRLKIYGTLHWPPEESKNFSFHKFNLASEFNGIIGLSSSIKKIDTRKIRIIPHGVNLDFWDNNGNSSFENYYLIIGDSNRNHNSQVEVIKSIYCLDPEARFILISRNKKIYRFYKDLNNLRIIKKFITDDELKSLYIKAKAVILMQNFCLASNVVLEAMSMNVPLITNRVGDIEEYLGNDYPLYINNDNMKQKLNAICFSDSYRREVAVYLNSLRTDFGWKRIIDETISFIQNK